MRFWGIYSSNMDEVYRVHIANVSLIIYAKKNTLLDTNYRYFNIMLLAA
nr:hypothetical protein [Colwellia sp. 20A7]